MRFRLLGPVEADDGGKAVEIGHPRQRCVLAGLLVDANTLVSEGQLVERVWGGGPLPAHPVRALQTYLSMLRRSITEELVISRQAAGYRAIVSPEAVDLYRFRQLASQARATADDAAAAALLGEALGLWQGEAFAGLDSPWLSAMRTALGAERLSARLDLADVQLRLGRNAVVAAELSGLVADHPLDERMAGQYMTALRGSGRQADALAHYQRIRRRLAEELGADPGPLLQRLYQEILAGRGPDVRPGGTRPAGPVVATVPAQGGSNEVAALVRGHLGPAGTERGVVARTLPRSEQVNLQRAVDAWSSRPGRRVTVHGITVPRRFGNVTMRNLVAGYRLPPVRLAAPALVELPDGPGSARGCLCEALLLVEDATGRYVVLILATPEHPDEVRVEVAGLPAGQAHQLLADLDQLRLELNVYRGRLLEVSPAPTGGLRIDFTAPYGVTRDDVVLPATVLSRIERHALCVAAHRKPLLDAGQHLKRGLLLHGPAGAGKTHCTRYLLGQLDGYTRLVMNGNAPAAVRPVADLARALLPAVVVIEDVDLLARDRSRWPDHGPALHDLLDAMDGTGPDADLLFLLTTSRADALDAALTRHGRVDAAVELPLPDWPARERLLGRYGRGISLDLAPGDLTTAIHRTDGTTASLLKELMRRSVLEALHDQAGSEDFLGPTVTGAHLARALHDLLATSASPRG